MPQVIYTEEAKQDLVRFANFLVENEAKEQAKTVITVILSNVKRLYGSSGYVCLYSFDPILEVVLIHAFRHQRELGYSAF